MGKFTSTTKGTFPTLVVLFCLAGSALLTAQADEASSWILLLDTPAGEKELAETIQSALPDHISLRSVRPLFSPSESPQAASGSAGRLRRYHLIEFDRQVNTFPMTFEGGVIFPNHRYSVERHDDEDHLDPFRHDQWGLDAIRIDRAWELTRGSSNVVVAVLDTGIELDHPELEPNLFINQAEDVNGSGRFEPWSSSTVIDGVSGDLDGVDQEGNGYIDDVSGFDFVDQVTANLGDWSGRDGVAVDEQGHGTLVSGVIGAVGGNSRGISGVAPGCRIMPLRAFDATGDGEDDDIAAAIIYAADNGADVLNMSFGDLYRSPLLADAVRYAAERGVILVASSGNNGISDPHYPSGFNDVISVGATRADGLLSFFSAFGSQISLVAPGEDILTTSLDRDYRIVSGTSFSAPHVSGVAALILSLHPERDRDEVRYALEQGATDLGPVGWDTDFGSGLLDTFRSLMVPGGGRFTIESPEIDSGVSGTGNFAVRGGVIGVGVREWDVAWGSGELPEEWNVVSRGSLNVLSGDLADVSAGSLPQGVVTVALRASFTDGSTNEHRIRLYVDDSPPGISDLALHPVWIAQQQGLVVSASTDDRARAFLEVTLESGEQLVVAPEEGKTGLTHQHYWILRPHDLGAGSMVDVRVIATNPAGLRSQTLPRSVVIPDQGAPVNSYMRTPGSLPYGFLLKPDTARPGRPRFLMLNRFENLSFSRTILYRLQGDDLVPVDSLGNWVPRGIGDSDGDGLLEALLQSTGTGIITEQTEPDGTLFASIALTDTVNGKFYPGAFVDVDRDGRDEVVGYTVDEQTGDDRLAVWRREGDKLVLIATADNSSGFPALTQRNSFGASDVEVADVDGDGYPEFLVGDADGDVLLFSWSPAGKIVQRWSVENEGVESDKTLTFADLDADGRPEVVYGFQPQSGITDSNDYEVPLWKLRGIRFDTEWNSEQIFEEQFAWPRPVRTFRSGIDAGQLDDRPGDELAVILFPDAWVFTWDLIEGRLRAIWGRGGAMLNEPSIFRGSSNESPRFAVGDGSVIDFYSFDSASLSGPLPTLLSGWSMSDSSAFLSWSQVKGATLYRLYRELPEADPGTFSFVAEIDSTEYLDGGSDLEGGRLVSGESYRYLVLTVDSEGRTGRESNLVTISPHSRIVPLAFDPISTRQFRVHFSRPISSHLIRTGALRVLRSGEEEVGISSLLLDGDSSVVATLTRAMPGELLTLRASSLLRDRSGAPADTTAILAGMMPETDILPSFWVTGARPLEGKRIEIRFSQPIDPGSLDPSDFQLSPSGAVVDVAFAGGTDNTVILELPPDYPLGPFGYTYSIQVLSLLSSTGEEIPNGPGSVAGFTIAAESLDQISLHPQPFSYITEDRVTFTGLPMRGVIEIYTVSGRILRELEIARGDGATEWDGLDASGRQLLPGTYLFRVRWTDSSGMEIESALGKIAIVP